MCFPVDSLLRLILMRCVSCLIREGGLDECTCRAEHDSNSLARVASFGNKLFAFDRNADTVLEQMIKCFRLYASIYRVVQFWVLAAKISATSFAQSGMHAHNVKLKANRYNATRGPSSRKDAVNLPVHNDGSIAIENDAHCSSAPKRGRASFPKAPRPDDRKAIRSTPKRYVIFLMAKGAKLIQVSSPTRVGSIGRRSRPWCRRCLVQHGPSTPHRPDCKDKV